MKTLMLSMMCVLSLVSCGCAQEKSPQQVPQKTQESSAILLDDFEGAISGGAQGTVDFGAGNGSVVKVAAATDIMHAGTQSLKVEFDAIAGGYMYIAKGFGLDAKNAVWLVKSADIDWKKYTAISFYMYGSDTKGALAFDVKDDGNEMWRFMVTDDFKGWKQIVSSFKDFFARGDWQPDNADKNAEMNFPLKSYQFEPLPIGKGVWYFDDIELITQ